MSSPAMQQQVFSFFSILLTVVLDQLYTEKIMDLFLTTVITEAPEVYPSCELKCCKVNESLSNVLITVNNIY